MMKDFFNLYSHGFIRAAVCVPEVRVADVSFNAQQTIGLAKQAAAKKALFALFPELGLSAYSNEDLFHQEALLQRVQEALGLVLEKTKGLNTILVVGAPLRVDSFLFNGAVVMYRGRILGVALKSYLPNYREYYEGRQFRPAEDALSKTITSAGNGISLSGRTCSSRWRTSRASRSTSRSAKTSGSPCPRRALRRWPAPRCSPTSRPRTSPSANPNTGTAWRPTSRPDAWRPTSMRRRAPASRRRILPGTARPWPTRTARCLPNRSDSHRKRRWSLPTSTWTASSRTGCGSRASARTPGSSGTGPIGSGR